jgi:predicted DNA-binding transcriptional regulator YafY
LEDVEALYTQDVFAYFDRYADGDPYADEIYIAHFRTVLAALREKRKLRVRFEGSTGRRHTRLVVPYRIEYSSKDGKFRLIVAAGFGGTINIGRISACEPAEPYSPGEAVPPRRMTKTLVLELTDERNALERAMLHFSHLEKETERLPDEARYRITLKYDRGDDAEMLIRVLAFGPLLRVLSPDDFVERMRERLNRQKKLEAGR